MSKTVNKEAEPALFAMKDVTPKKGDDKKPEPENKPAKKKTKAKREASNAVAVAASQQAPVIRDDQPVNLLAVLARAAADPNVNPEKMRELRAIQKEIRDDEARIAFNEDFIAMQNELPVINAKGRIEIRAKDAKGERTGAVQQSTAYATFNEIVRIIKPVLQKHHFAISYSTDQSPDGRMIVKGFLKHASGHQETTTLALPLETSGSKNNVQGFGSSLSYGKRYATIALLNIVSEAMEDHDDDGTKAGGGNEDRVPDLPKRLSLSQSESLTTLMKNCKVSVDGFCERYGIAAVIDLNPSMLDEAEKALRAHAKKHNITLPEQK